MSEIKNTPVDQDAMAILLSAAGKDATIDARTAFSPELDRAWMTLFRHLAALEDEVFNAIQDRALALAGGNWDDRPEAGRVAERLSLVQEERHHRWVADELSAGRDPYRPA